MALALAAGAAQATVLVNLPHDPTTKQATETSIEVDFNSTGGAGDIAFTLDGYGSLDGNVSSGLNGEDDFTLTLNGVVVIKGAFNMGGGGADQVFTAPDGATFVSHTPPPPAFGTGGKVDVAAALNLASGANVLVFAYNSHQGAGFIGPQGIGDEGWGLQDLIVNGAGEAAPPLPGEQPPPPILPGPDGGGVPEPAAWALMLLGFGGIGGALRSRRRAVAA